MTLVRWRCGLSGHEGADYALSGLQCRRSTILTHRRVLEQGGGQTSTQDCLRNVNANNAKKHKHTILDSTTFRNTNANHLAEQLHSKTVGSTGKPNFVFSVVVHCVGMLKLEAPGSPRVNSRGGKWLACSRQGADWRRNAENPLDAHDADLPEAAMAEAHDEWLLSQEEHKDDAVPIEPPPSVCPETEAAATVSERGG